LVVVQAAAAAALVGVHAEQVEDLHLVAVREVAAAVAPALAAGRGHERAHELDVIIEAAVELLLRREVALRDLDRAVLAGLPLLRGPRRIDLVPVLAVEDDDRPLRRLLPHRGRLPLDALHLIRGAARGALDGARAVGAGPLDVAALVLERDGVALDLAVELDFADLAAAEILAEIDLEGVLAHRDDAGLELP